MRQPKQLTENRRQKAEGIEKKTNKENIKKKYLKKKTLKKYC